MRNTTSTVEIPQSNTDPKRIRSSSGRRKLSSSPIVSFSPEFLRLQEMRNARNTPGCEKSHSETETDNSPFVANEQLKRK